MTPADCDRSFLDRERCVVDADKSPAGGGGWERTTTEGANRAFDGAQGGFTPARIHEYPTGSDHGQGTNFHDSLKACVAMICVVVLVAVHPAYPRARLIKHYELTPESTDSMVAESKREMKQRVRSPLAARRSPHRRTTKLTERFSWRRPSPH